MARWKDAQSCPLVIRWLWADVKADGHRACVRGFDRKWLSNCEQPVRGTHGDWLIHSRIVLGRWGWMSLNMSLSDKQGRAVEYRVVFFTIKWYPFAFVYAFSVNYLSCSARSYAKAPRLINAGCLKLIWFQWSKCFMIRFCFKTPGIAGWPGPGPLFRCCMAPKTKIQMLLPPVPFRSDPT